MTDFIVVGVGGVGMAHICAIGRTGNKVKAIVDVDENILERSTTKWENRWLGLVEETPVQKQTQYFLSVEDIDVLTLKEKDVFVLATPPDTHYELVRWILKNTPSKILIEKPYTLPHWFGDSKRIIPSCEWVWHSGIINYCETYKIKSIGMRYPASNTTEWDQNLMFDFAPHLFSILVRFESVDTVRFLFGNKNRFSICVNEKIDVWGDRKEGDYGLYINDICFKWENDLFDKQILGLNSIQPMWEELLCLENKIQKML